MATKWNNSRLFIVFVLLIGVFLLLRYLNSSRTKGNFDPNIISLDTAAISEILLYPKVTNQEEIRLFKNEGRWMVQKGDFVTKAMQASVHALINSILNIKPTRLAARSEEKWEKFQVNDSLATKVNVIQEGKEDLGLMIGKFSYKQVPQNNPNQKQGIKSISYFRLAGEKEVYATEGFLTIAFNRDINAFRDQTFLKAKKDDINKLSFQMTDSMSYTLQRVDSTWIIKGNKADHGKVNELLSKLTANNQNQFVDDFKIGDSPLTSLKIEGNNMEPINISSYQYDSASVIMTSSLNSNALFKIPKSGIYEDLFRPAEFYLDSIQ